MHIGPGSYMEQDKSPDGKYSQRIVSLFNRSDRFKQNRDKNPGPG